MNSEKKIGCYKNKCRICLQLIPNISFFELHEYFEDLFFEITATKLISSDKLSKKVCFACNEQMGKVSGIRTGFIANQNTLLELLQTAHPETIEAVVVKQETLESIVLKSEIKEENLSFADSSSSSDFGKDEDYRKLKEEMAFFIPMKVPVRPKKITLEIEAAPKKKSPGECPICHKLFTTKTAVKHHVAAVHEGKTRYNCKFEGCDYKCYQSGNMKLHHQYVHKMTGLARTFVCEICGAVFRAAYKLKCHREMKHFNIRNFSCDICGRSFHRKTFIRNHMRTHAVDRILFPCDFPGCSAKSKSIWSLRFHKKAVHDKSRDFECFCGRKFPLKGFLTHHQKHFHNKSKAKDIKCDQCEKMFSTLTGFQLHKNTAHPANGIKPSFSCEICASTYSLESALKTHMKVHGNPQFECEHCDKKFHFRTRLLDHQEHHETLAFPCEHCKRSFRKDTQLREHYKKVHFKDKTTYRCELCASTFTRRMTYRDHVLKQHPELEANFLKDLLERISKMLPEEKSLKVAK